MNLLNKRKELIQSNPDSCSELQQCIKKSFSQCEEMPTLSLDESGVIYDCSKSCTKYFGYQHPDLVKNHISMLIPQLSGVELVKAGQVNPVLNYLCRCGHLYFAQNRQGHSVPSNLSFVRVGQDGRHFLRLFVHPLAGMAT